jgi:hypothetical protein
MKFDLYEKFLAEQQDNAARSQKMQDKKEKAERQYRELLTEYELIMAKSLTTDTDLSKELGRLDESIDKAKREMERTQREYEVYNRVRPSASITQEKVIAAWNSEFNPNHYENEIKPALETLDASKKAYYEAMCTYYDKVREITDFREVVSSSLGHEFPYKFQIKKLDTREEFEHYFIQQEDDAKAQSRYREAN